MKGSIQRYLEDKEDGILGEGGIHTDDFERIYRYPIKYTIRTHIHKEDKWHDVLHKGWIVDANETVSKVGEYNQYKLSIVILRENQKQYDLAKRVCLVHCNSAAHVDWDSITCTKDKVLAIPEFEDRPKLDFVDEEI